MSAALVTYKSVENWLKTSIFIRQHPWTVVDQRIDSSLQRFAYYPLTHRATKKKPLLETPITLDNCEITAQAGIQFPKLSFEQ